MSLASFCELPLQKGSFFYSFCFHWPKGGLTQHALWNHLCPGYFSAELESGRKALRSRGGRGPWVGVGSSCQAYFHKLPLPSSWSRLDCLYKLVASSNTLLVWARMYPRRLTAFTLPSTCPFPAGGAGIVGAFSMLSYFSPVPPPFTEYLSYLQGTMSFYCIQKATSLSSQPLFSTPGCSLPPSTLSTGV